MTPSAMEMIPPLPDLNKSESFDVEVDVEREDLDIPTNINQTTPKRRQKQVSDLSVMSVGEPSESEPHLSFLKNAFVSTPHSPQQQSPTAGSVGSAAPFFGWFLDLDSASHDTRVKYPEFPSKDNGNSTSSKRVKQISNITALTADLSLTESTVASPKRKAKTISSRYHRKSNKVKAQSDHVEVPVFPSLTADSFDEKDQYRGIHRHLKVRLNKMAKLHYFRQKSK